MYDGRQKTVLMDLVQHNLAEKFVKLHFNFLSITLRFHEMCFNFSMEVANSFLRVCEISDATSKTVLSK